MSVDQDRGVALRITFTRDDIEVIEAIVQNYGYKVDHTGILAHILNEYRMTQGEEDVE